MPITKEVLITTTFSTEIESRRNLSATFVPLMKGVNYSRQRRRSDNSVTTLCADAGASFSFSMNVDTADVIFVAADRMPVMEAITLNGSMLACSRQGGLIK